MTTTTAAPPRADSAGGIRERFDRLAAEWRQESRYLSNTAQMAM